MSTNFSQKAARFFQICDIFLLIPASLGALFALILLLMSIVGSSAEAFMLSFLSILAFGIGITLFIGHIKHSRGNLAQNKIMPLWITTLIVNLVPLLIVGFFYYRASRKIQEANIYFIAALLFWLLNVSLASGAIWFEKNEKRSYELLRKIFPKI